MKTTGKEFKAFECDEAYWLLETSEIEHTYMDDVLLLINGEEVEDWIDGDIKNTDKIVIMDGHVMNCAKGPKNQSLAAYFKRWKKDQATVTMIVECDKTKQDEVMAAIKAAGGKVAK